MTGDLPEGALPPASAPPRPASPARKLTWREKRWLRRRRRRVFEEVLGWIFVPLILIGSYWLLSTVLNAMGTSPRALVDGVKTVVQGLEKR